MVGGSGREGAMVHSDERWVGYARLSEMGRGHATVCHTVGEWARDDDDGIREVHDNTLEGMWTGLRNHLRIFRGGRVPNSLARLNSPTEQISLASRPSGCSHGRTHAPRRRRVPCPTKDGPTRRMGRRAMPA